MTDTPGEQLTEEPQSERGPMGSRDTGSDEPSAGPADRPAGRAEDGETTPRWTRRSPSTARPTCRPGTPAAEPTTAAKPHARGGAHEHRFIRRG